MEKPDAEPSKDIAGDTDAANGTASACSLEKVRAGLSAKLEQPSAHYSTMTPLGKGSSGEVHRAQDTLLGRNVAIKFLKPHYRDKPEVVDRFLKEARATAQLEHPNIMPVHELGMNDELGIYFTMKNVQGETLQDILDRLESKTSFYLKKYPLGLLLEIFLSVCNGVAFAHSKGLIHRDLKPSNIMIGEYGEVLVLDWGLVKKADAEDAAASSVQLQMDELGADSKMLEGSISGTPNYMSPEQAEGRVDAIDFQSDVYSLGAILYHLLAHVAPFEKMQLGRLLESVKVGHFKAPRVRSPKLKIPRELEAVCLKAMSRFPVRRYSTVERLAEDIRSYIGHERVHAYKAPRVVRFWKSCQRNPIGASVTMGVVVALLLAFGAQRAMLYGAYRSNYDRAEVLRGQGTVLMDEITTLYDELQGVRGQTELKAKTPREMELDQLLAQKQAGLAAQFNIAKALYEGIPEPYRKRKYLHGGLSDLYLKEIELALYCGQYDLAQVGLETALLHLKQEVRPVPLDIWQNLSLLEYGIGGDGSLTITGDGGVREVMVWPVVADGPRLVQGDAVARGKLPLQRERIEKGAYLLMVTREDGGLMPVPIFIDHSENKTVELKIPAGIPAGMVFVAGGEFFYGGMESRFYRRNKRSLPPFFIKKHETTFAEYIGFWKTLSSRRLRSKYMSRIRFTDEDHRDMDAWDPAGNLTDERLQLNYPVVGVSLEAATAFCEWKSEQTGTTIRLPTAFEWEKAARGVDGRKYVWGNGFTDTGNLTLTKNNKKGKARFPLWAPPGKFPRDISVYNAYDMAGNVREMTTTKLPGSDTFYQIKGGSASTPPTFLPCCYASDTPVVPSDVGFRYIQEIQGE